MFPADLAVPKGPTRWQGPAVGAKAGMGATGRWVPYPAVKGGLPLQEAQVGRGARAHPTGAAAAGVAVAASTTAVGAVEAVVFMVGPRGKAVERLAPGQAMPVPEELAGKMTVMFWWAAAGERGAMTTVPTDLTEPTAVTTG